MGNKIINLLSIKSNVCMKFDDIREKLNADKSELEGVLTSLEKKGIIYQNKSGKYSLVSRTSLKNGVVYMSKKNRPVVNIDGIGSFDLFFDKNNSVQNNSRVLVDLNTNTGIATVVKVLNGHNNTFIGEVVNSDGRLVIRSKGREDIPINKEYPEGINVVVDSNNKIVEVLDSDYEVKIKGLLSKRVPLTYSDAYLRELSKVREVHSNRDIKKYLDNGAIDLRGKDIVTIDSDDTKDFDDAVYADDNTLIIAIADLLEVVEEGSLIEKDAIKRGTSIYYPGSVIPMFHKKISNGICSINPNTIRFANSIIYKLDENHNVIGYSFKKSIINSRGKLTYDKVNEYLEKGNIVKGYDKFTDNLDNLYETAMKVKRGMLEKGFLMFSSDEVKFVFEDKVVTGIKGRYQGKAEELIEFLMILYNMTKTDYMVRHNLPFIARNHDAPSKKKIDNWINLLNQRGYNIDKSKEYTVEEIRKILNAYSDSKEKQVLDKRGILSESKAVYSAISTGHFAMNFENYGTFSSPIRRLSDYINTRIFDDAKKYGDDYAINKWAPKVDRLAKICTDTEVLADQIERKAYELQKLEYMSNIELGTIYNGIVSGVSNCYIKVLLPNNVYGKIFVGKKNHELSSDGFSLINKINGDRISVGDSITVSLSKVDMDREEIYLLNVPCRRENYEEKKKKKAKKR